MGITIISYAYHQVFSLEDFGEETKTKKLNSCRINYDSLVLLHEVRRGQNPQSPIMEQAPRTRRQKRRPTKPHPQEKKVMAKRDQQPSNYAFIDSQNLNLAIRGLKWKIDWKKLRVLLTDKYQIGKAFLFIGYVPGNEKLYTSLQEAGYIVVFRPTLEKNGIVKGNCDAELVLHAMIEYNNYAKAMIVSGDGDFHCLIEYLAEHDKLLKIGIPSRRGFSSLLRKYAEYFLFLQDHRKKIEYRLQGRGKDKIQDA